jgi:hypothetical protein
MDFRKGIFLSPFPKMNKDGMGDGFSRCGSAGSLMR